MNCPLLQTTIGLRRQSAQEVSFRPRLTGFLHDSQSIQAMVSRQTRSLDLIILTNLGPSLRVHSYLFPWESAFLI